MMFSLGLILFIPILDLLTLLLLYVLLLIMMDSWRLMFDSDWTQN